MFSPPVGVLELLGVIVLDVATVRLVCENQFTLSPYQPLFSTVVSSSYEKIPDLWFYGPFRTWRDKKDVVLFC